MSKRRLQDGRCASKKLKRRFPCVSKSETADYEDTGCCCTSICSSQVDLPSQAQECCMGRPITVDRASAVAKIDALLLSANDDRHALAKRLSDRAQARFKRGRMSEAFKDALSIIQVMPNLPVGYIVAGRFYSMLERRFDAIDVCYRGLAQVPLGEPGYHELVIALAEYTTKLNKIRTKIKIDPIGKLPADLLVSICQLLSLEDRIAWTKASSAWREGLFQCDALWSCFAMDNADPRWDIFSAVYMQIKDLTIGAFRRIPAIRLFNKMDMKATFKHLQSLRIFGCQAPKELLCIALRHMRQLTAFSITSPNVSIVDILQNCSTLKALTFIETSNHPKVELCNHANLPHFLPLESLTVIYPQLSPTLLLARVLRRCHNLRNFFSNSDIRNTLEEPCYSHLRELYTLVYLTEKTMQVVIRESCRKTANVMPAEEDFLDYTKALERQLGDLYRAHPVVKSGTESFIIEQRCCAQNLRALDIADTFFKVLEFDHLLMVDYTAPFTEDHQHFATFIRNQPSLRSLRTVNGNILADPIVLSSLSASAYLERIMLEEAFIEEKTFAMFTRHQESLGDRSPLQYLGFYGVFGINDGVIQSIAALPYLRSFTLQAQNASFTAHGLSHFADKLASSYRLERLALLNVSCLDNDIVAKLAKVHPLLSLMICNPGTSLTGQGVVRLSMNSRNLNEVRLIRCPGVSISNLSEIMTLYNVDVSIHH
ncbi:hypothetical protein BX666DRAFT_2031052 [Dichotomocladium elegans]|nr:hypothetical protein BX666DRAFT_2031052 [Dichotomocladium elegans]